MALPSPLNLLFEGAEADIPSGWERNPDFNDLYLKGAAAGAGGGGGGGALTHSHTSPAHTHTMNSHSHTGNMGASCNAENGGGGTSKAADNCHTHTFNIAGVTGGNLSDAITYQAVNHEPPFRKVIVIRPADGAAALDSNIITLWDQSTLPDGFSLATNLADKYLKGAPAGGDGGAGAGAYSHTHDVTHTHSSAVHGHVGLSGGESAHNIDYNTAPGGGALCSQHSHTVTLGNATESATQYVGSAGSAETDIEPLYKKLVAIKNTSGGPTALRLGMIAIHDGPVATIPKGWSRVSAMDGFHLKIAAVATEAYNSAGSNTHTHAASNSHTHSALGSHTHSGSTSVYGESGSTSSNPGDGNRSHSHPVSGVSSNTSAWANATIQADSANNEPPYRTVIFVKLTKIYAAGSMLN